MEPYDVIVNQPVVIDNVSQQHSFEIQPKQSKIKVIRCRSVVYVHHDIIFLWPRIC